MEPKDPNPLHYPRYYLGKAVVSGVSRGWHALTRFVRDFGRTDSHPSRITAALLGLILFAALLGIYLDASYARHLANPNDKVLPSLDQIWHAAVQVSTVPDRQGNIWLWTDLAATATRFALSLAFISVGAILGLLMGLFPYIKALSENFVIAIDKVVAFSLLPLLMVVFGIEEGFRIGLVVIAVFPSIVLGAYAEAISYPEELKTKARTLGASHWDLAFRVVLPGIMPKMLDLLRLNFKSIALMLIAGEMIVASAGLGYRINAVRRYMAMDVVMVYVIVITVLLFILDIGVTRLIKWRYPWFNKD